MPSAEPGADMRRRTFITLVGGAAAALSILRPRATRAQEPGRNYRLGGVHTSPRNAPHHVALFEELRRAGFIEGQNLTVDGHGYGLRIERYEEHAAELVKAQVDVILAGGDAAVRAAQRATTVIPILALTDDMLGQGFVRSLAKPGGNTTGVSILASELDGKRQDLIMETAPGLRRMAALADRVTSTAARLQALQDAAHAHGVELVVHRIDRPEEIAPAIDAARASDAGALNVLASAMLFNNRTIILDRVASLRLPLSINGRKWRRRAGSSATGRASSNSIETWRPGSSSRCCAAPSPPTCLSSSRPSLSSSSICNPPKLSVTKCPPG